MRESDHGGLRKLRQSTFTAGVGSRGETLRGQIGALAVLPICCQRENREKAKSCKKRPTKELCEQKNGRGERMGVELFLLGIKGLDLMRLVLTNLETS